MEESNALVSQELQTLKMYMPLTVIKYEHYEWSDLAGDYIYNKNKIYELKEKLSERVLWHLNNADIQRASSFPFDVFVNDVPLRVREETEIDFILKAREYKQKYIYQGVFLVSLLNSSATICKEVFTISLIAPREFPQIGKDNSYVFSLPNNKKKMLIAGVWEPTHPNEWNGKEFTVERISDKPLEKQYSASVSLQVILNEVE